MSSDTTKPRTVIVHERAAGFAQAIAAGRHQLTGDEPTDVRGTHTRPNPKLRPAGEPAGACEQAPGVPDASVPYLRRDAAGPEWVAAFGHSAASLLQEECR